MPEPPLIPGGLTPHMLSGTMPAPPEKAAPDESNVDCRCHAVLVLFRHPGDGLRARKTLVGPDPARDPDRRAGLVEAKERSRIPGAVHRDREAARCRHRRSRPRLE